MRRTVQLVLLCLVGAAFGDDDFDIGDVIDKIEWELRNGIFKARLEVTIFENGTALRTENVMEYHDATTGSHSMHLMSTGDQFFYYSKLSIPIFVKIAGNGDSCDRMSLSSAAADPSIFFYKTSTNAHVDDYFLGPSAMLKMLPKENMTELQPAPGSARGIGSFSYVFKNIRKPDSFVELLFPNKDWKINYNSKRRVPFPIRMTIADDTTNTVLDFYEMEHLTSTELFMMGNNLQMPFLKNNCKMPPPTNKPQPTLASKFSVSSSAPSLFQTEKMWFDSDSKLVRIDNMVGQSIVFDERHGLIYEKSGTCNVLANRDAVGGAFYSIGYLAVLAFRTLGNKFYIGEGSVRGINVDIWESEGNEMFDSARFYITKKNLTLSINAQQEDHIPIQVLLRSKELNTTLSTEIQFFDYFGTDDEIEFRKNFNIEDCQGESTYMEIFFESDKDFNVDEMKTSNAPEELAQSTLTAVIATTGISSLQIPHIQVEVKDSRKITATLKVLASPPYLASFTLRVDEKFPQYNMKPLEGVSAEECAQKCVTGDPCATIVYCPQEKRCYTMSDRTNWPKPLDRSPSTCSAYDKSLNVVKEAYRTIDEIADILTDKVVNGAPEFKFTASSDEGEFKFHAMKLNAYVSQFNDRGARGPYKMEFEKKSLISDFPSNVPIAKDVSTVGECYRECIKDNGIACASFSFCIKSQKCILSNLNINKGTTPDPQQNDAMQVDAAECMVFSVNYLNQFEKLEGKIRKSASKSHDRAKVAGDCAFRCRQQEHENIAECRSFDFCPKSQTCFYFDTHYSQEGDRNETMSTNQYCDHYALRYSADFTAVDNILMDGVPTQRINSISMEECSKRCLEESDNKCMSMAYCDGGRDESTTMACYMYADIPEHAKGSTKNEHCKLYIPSSIITDIISPSRQAQKVRATIIAGMGNGAFGTLLFVMLVIGAIIGTVIYKKKIDGTSITTTSSPGSSRLQETTIAYNKHEDEHDDSQA